MASSHHIFRCSHRWFFPQSGNNSPTVRRIASSSSSSTSTDSFCDCAKAKKQDCICGEEDTNFDWLWDERTMSAACHLSKDGREVKFHEEYSCGTAAIRGTKVLDGKKQYYWEVKMTTPVYGTDMMIGVGTNAAKLDKYRYNYCSLLGSDTDTWGLSYSGQIHHDGKAIRYSPKFGEGSLIGIHLDAWNGTITFYKNRQPLGVAFTNLQGKSLYPMVSSTAARSGMKMIRTRSFDSSLQYLCLRKLRENIPANMSVTDALKMPPGLSQILKKNVDWLINSSSSFSSSSSVNYSTFAMGTKRGHSDLEETEQAKKMRYS